MKIKTDKLTNVLGIIGAIIIIQQTYFPELISKEYTAPILAGIISTFGIATNKRKITIWFNGENGQTDKTIDEIEAEIEKKCQEIEELIEKAEKVCRIRNKGGRNE
jgi:hypothetical protein